MTTKTNESNTAERIPVVRAGFALKSLRDSGYSFAAALGEVIDNSLEANANSIRIRLDEGTNHRGKRHVHRVACADDGSGMPLEVLHHYPQLGFSTRYMSETTIGKYGVGAKLAALNFGQRIDVWSRTEGDGPWYHVAIDFETVFDTDQADEEVGIDPPKPKPVPEDLRELLPPKSGTLVVWSKVDRLEEGRLAPDFEGLRIDVERELSRMFRHFIHGGIDITVNGTQLLPHDPLFLMDGTWADVVLSKAAGSKAKAPQHYPAEVIMREKIKVGDGHASLVVSLYPREVTRRRGMGGDDLAKRLRVPENEGSISFVRLDREINYANVPRIFPRGVQEADRFIGIEVSFTPELDGYLGVRNVKRGVEPHDELRAAIRKLLSKAMTEARKKLDERWGEVARETREHGGEHDAIEEAVAAADRTLPKSRAKGPDTDTERDQVLDDLANDLGIAKAEDRENYKKKIADLPFVIESVDFPGESFVDIQHVNGQVIIRINTRHRFYREMWEPLQQISHTDPGTVTGDEAVRVARRTIEALTLLIVAYGKAESLNENPTEAYGELRTYWGMFLGSLLTKVKGVV